MAQLIGIAGPGGEERRRFLERTRAVMEPFPGLSTGSADSTNLSLDWAAPASAPVSSNAVEGLHRFRMGLPGGTYGVAVLEDAPGSVRIETDLLGLFPVYYHATVQRLLFSTTPAAFRYAEDSRTALDIEGLVGILLTNIAVEGRTLVEGVRRLRAGHALCWKRDVGAREEATSPLRPSDRYFGEPFERHLEIADGALAGAVAEEDDTDRPAMLLSGGLDSRVLAGYLSGAFGARVRAITQGDERDYEMRCAARVARALGWTQEKVPTDAGAFEASALLKVEHEHLTHGFNTPYFTQLAGKVGRFGTRLFNGVHGDAALGFGTVSDLASADDGLFSFPAFFARLNRSGFTPAQVRRLIPPSVLKDAVEAVTGRLRERYESTPGAPFQRAWLFELLVCDRLQVGFIPRMMSFGAWPAMPLVDAGLLKEVLAMPFESLRGRRMERELVCRKFPYLAVLPLDRNGYDLSPLFGLKRLLSRNPLTVSQKWVCASEHLRARLHRAGTRFAKGSWDRRFYYQTFNINGEGWKRLRLRAEVSRRKLETLFDPAVLAELWPAPSVAVRAENGIRDVQGLKVLVGLAMWAERYL